MMLINGSPLIGYARAFKMVAIGGRYGGGKTALSFRLAYDLLRYNGYRYLVTNLPSPWRDDRDNIIPDANGALNAVIILDEAGLFLDDPARAKKFQAALRKLNCVVIMPSITPVSSRVKFVEVERTFNGQVLGLPLWVYSMIVRGDRKNKDVFAWWQPSEIFGIYSTNSYPIDDRGISEFLLKAVGKFREKYADVLPYDDSVLSGDGAEIREDSGSMAMLEAAEIIQQAAGSIPVYSGGRGRRR